METSDNSSNYSGGSRNTPEVKSSGLYKTLVIVFIVAVALIAIPIVVNRVKVEKNSKVKQTINITEIPKLRYHWEIEKTVRIYFNGEYGEIVRLATPGTNFSMENATQPYCVHNKIKEYCSYGTEDIGARMPSSTNNGELRFKSQNGKIGSIDIIFWIWVNY